MHRLEAIIDV